MIPFPFSAIVAQDELKLALQLVVVDPNLGGVLVFGDRGTGKSTAVRALAALLPRMRVAAKGALTTAIRPSTVPTAGHCPFCAEVVASGESRATTGESAIPVVDLPLGARRRTAWSARSTWSALSPGVSVPSLPASSRGRTAASSTSTR